MSETVHLAYFTAGETVSSARVGGLTCVPCTGILAGVGILRQITRYSVWIRRNESPAVEYVDKIRVKRAVDRRWDTQTFSFLGAP